jgi:hypothetical protein
MGSEFAQRLPDQLLEGADPIRDLCESALGIALAEAQAPERVKGFRPYLNSSCAHRGAVARPVRMGEMWRGSRSRDDEPAPVDGEVMSTAKREEIFRVVVAAFRPESDVMGLRKNRVPTTGDATFAAVAAKDCTPGRRWDGLRSADWSCAHVDAREFVVADTYVGTTGYFSMDAHVDVDVSDVLAVALRHLDDFRTDVDGLAATLLRCPVAALTNRERYLVARAPRIPRARECLTAEKQDGCLLVDRLARVAAHFRQRFAKGREDLARQLELEHVAFDLRVRNVVGEASRTMSTHQLFDFSDGPPPGGFEPFLFGGRRRDTRELARMREADGTHLQVMGDFGELFERFGDAELVLGETRAVAEKTLRVFVEGRVAEAHVHSRAVGSQQPAPFLEVQSRSLGGETNELFVRLTPRDAFQNDC